MLRTVRVRSFVSNPWKQVSQTESVPGRDLNLISLMLGEDMIQREFSTEDNKQVKIFLEPGFRWFICSVYWKYDTQRCSRVNARNIYFSHLYYSKILRCEIIRTCTVTIFSSLFLHSLLEIFIFRVPGFRRDHHSSYKIYLFSSSTRAAMLFWWMLLPS